MGWLAEKLDTGREEIEFDTLALAVIDKDSVVEAIDRDVNIKELAEIDTDDEVELSQVDAISSCQFSSFARNVAWN